MITNVIAKQIKFMEGNSDLKTIPIICECIEFFILRTISVTTLNLLVILSR